MSTKIYNGYKLKRYLSLKELNEFVNSVREKLSKFTVEKLEKDVANLATEMNDIKSLYGLDVAKEIFKDKHLGDKLYFSAWLYYRKCYDEFKDYLDIYYAEVVFIPIERKLLALFYTEDDDYTKIWESFDLVEDYMYYNNFDRPEDVSKKSWETRGKNWDKALGYTGIPSMQGLSAKLLLGMPNITDINIDTIKTYIPSIDTRANNIVDKIIQYEKSQTYKEFLEYKKTDEYTEIRERKIKEIQEKLKDIEIVIA